MTLEYSWYLVVLCLLLGVAYAAAMYFVGRSRFVPRVQWLLSTLRALAVSAIAFLLLAPMVRRTVHDRQPPLVVLADDISWSVWTMIPAGMELPLPELQKRLEGDFRILYTSNLDNRDQTDLGALLDVPRDAAAVVLATDGIYNRGQNPATVAERLGIPVYTVAMGDTTQENDAWLSHLRANRIAYRNSEMTVEVTVNAHGLEGERTGLHVVGPQGAGTLASREIVYTDDHFSTTVTLTIPVGDRAGLWRYDVYLDPLIASGETPGDNNHLAFFVDVIDNRRQVAIIGAAPHPDLTALKQAVESSPDYEATVVLASEVDRRWKADDYQLAVLHNLPTASQAVPEAVRDLPQVYVVGMQTDLPRFNAMKLGLEITSRVRKSTDYAAVYNEAFTLFHYDRSDGEALEQLPPLTAPFGEARLAEGVQSLLTARLGNIDTRQPLVAATTMGGRRRAFVWGEGLWRWRLHDYLSHQSHDHFDRMVSQLANFAAQEAGRDRFRVEAERVYPAGQNVTLGAQLYNEAYEPVNTPEATLRLAGDGMKAADFAFVRQGDGYALSLGSLAEGTYRYRATTQLDGQTLTDEGAFAVEAQNLEESTHTADHTLLRTMSALSGGRMFYPDEVDELEAALRDIKPVIHTHTRHSELIGLWPVLALVLLLLAAEWVLRKYHGEV